MQRHNGWDQAESLTAPSTFFAAEHLSALVTSAAICSRSTTSICPILNLVTRMPVMTASLFSLCSVVRVVNLFWVGI